MGKVKRAKNKLHVPAAKSSGSSELGSVHGVTPLPNEFMKCLNIVSLGDGTKPHSVAQRASCTGNDRCPVPHVKKQERRKLRRERWLESEANNSADCMVLVAPCDQLTLLEMEACRKAREHLRAAKERKKTVIIGDLQPLVSALLDIDLSTSSCSESTEKSHQKCRRTSRSSTVLSEINHYRQVLAHPVFKDNPLKTIIEHVQNSTALDRL